MSISKNVHRAAQFLVLASIVLAIVMVAVPAPVSAANGGFGPDGCLQEWYEYTYSPCDDRYNGNCGENQTWWKLWYCYSDPCAGIPKTCPWYVDDGCAPC